MALLGGMIVGAVTSALIPVFEAAFKETTDIRLLELLDMTQTALRRLVQEAPGTYHHAIIVGNLSSAAAEAVRANALLARVGAYYHDIGKLAKPDYFIENLGGRENIHDRLAPTMSALVIISHIREGVDIATRAKVPPEIIDIIREHHGTGLISYFYQKARDAAGENRAVVKEEDFRYPGPKPRRKEAAIVMLADQIEAAVKAMRSPEAPKIKALIQKIINDNFADGQLSECRLTLSDLQRIAEAFFKILEGSANVRPDYPQTEKLTADHPARKRKDASRSQRPKPPKAD
jgi:putative nucleotidyltransferase with HDIG domain